MNREQGRSDRRHRIELSEGEYVVARGVRRVRWSLHVNDGWMGVRDVQGAETQSVDARSGTVWEQRISLELPAGTRLLRVETRPQPPERRDALEYLTGTPRTRTQRTRQVFVVTPDGRLERAK